MRRTGGLRWSIAAITVVGLLLAVALFNRGSGQRALDGELGAAHKEGLLVSWQDFARLDPKIDPAQNAAIEYSRLSHGVIPGNLLQQVAADPSPSNLAKADRVLRDCAADLALLDEASPKPSCAFSRDWSRGGQTWLPEYNWVRKGAQLLELRAYREAAAGQDKAAIRDCDRILKIDEQLRADPSGEAQIVGSRAVRDAILAFGTIALQHPDQPQYRTALARDVGRIQPPDVRRLFRGEPCVMLWVLDLSTTQEGRAELGLREDVSSPIEPFARIMASPTESKANAIEIDRKIWAELQKPEPNWIHITTLYQHIEPALAAYPTGADLYTKLDEMMAPSEVWRAWNDQQICRKILLRALADPHKTVNVSDLTCFDGSKPSVLLDGKRIVIHAGDELIAIPPKP